MKKVAIHIERISAMRIKNNVYTDEVPDDYINIDHSETITLEHDRDITITVYPMSLAAFTNDIRRITWAEQLTTMTVPHYSTSKGEYSAKSMSPYSIFGEMSSGYYLKTNKVENARRKKEYLINRNTIVLDYDDITDEEDFIKSIQNKLKHYSYFVHTTFNHRKKTDENGNVISKYRVYIPINENVNGKDFENYALSLAISIGIKFDQSTHENTRLMGLPATDNVYQPFNYFYNDAGFITVSELKALVKKFPPVKTTTDSDGNKVIQKHGKKLTSEFIQSIMLGVKSDIERRPTLLKLMTLLGRGYHRDDLIFAFGILWGDACENPLTVEQVASVHKSALTYLDKIPNKQPMSETCHVCGLGTNEADRIIELFDNNYEFKKLEKELTISDTALKNAEMRCTVLESELEQLKQQMEDLEHDK